jgi:hypothetical protein
MKQAFLDAPEDIEISKRTRQRLLETGIALPFPDRILDRIRLVESGDHHRVWRVQKNQYRGLLVLADVAVKDDDRLWYHVSFSRGKTIPSYEDCTFIKQTFFGAERWAIQIFPEQKNHVSFHPNCLHLWHCLEGNPLPEFSKNGMI